VYHQITKRNKAIYQDYRYVINGDTLSMSPAGPFVCKKGCVIKLVGGALLAINGLLFHFLQQFSSPSEMLIAPVAGPNLIISRLSPGFYLKRD